MAFCIRFVSVFVLLVSLLSLSACANNAGKERPPEKIAVSKNMQQMFTQSVAHLQQQQYDEGIALLEKFIDNEKRIAAPYVNLGIAYSRTNKTRQAEMNFIAALRLDIGHAVANNELGLLYRKSGRFGAARISYQNALAKHPDYLPARKNMGILCEIYLHDLACAHKHYLAYLQYKPDDQIIADWALELEQRIKQQVR